MPSSISPPNAAVPKTTAASGSSTKATMPEYSSRRNCTPVGSFACAVARKKSAITSGDAANSAEAMNRLRVKSWRKVSPATVRLIGPIIASPGS